ncbi:MAG TPA: CopG family transcriptional regulator [Spirochaetia bacterium]|nr:CopG family transcriptional regulator [Spirochaetia bacterium]
MKAAEFDVIFDENQEDIIESLDIKNVKRIGREQKRVNVDIPVWMIESLDNEASRLGVTRQSIIKIWLAEKLEHVAHL